MRLLRHVLFLVVLTVPLGWKQPEVSANDKPLTCETFKVTAYTHTGNNTASGVYPYVGGVAVWSNPVTREPRFPYGSVVYIEGEPYVVIDTGGGLTWSHADIFLPTYSAAIQWGVRHLEVCF